MILVENSCRNERDIRPSLDIFEEIPWQQNYLLLRTIVRVVVGHWCLERFHDTCKMAFCAFEDHKVLSTFDNAAFPYLRFVQSQEFAFFFFLPEPFMNLSTLCFEYAFISQAWSSNENSRYLSISAASSFFCFFLVSSFCIHQHH